MTKPILLFSYPLPMEGIVGWLAGMGYPTYLSLRGCARALAALVERGKPVPQVLLESSANATPKVDAAELLEAGQALTEHETKRLLEAYAIPGPAQTWCARPTKLSRPPRRLATPSP